MKKLKVKEARLKLQLKRDALKFVKSADDLLSSSIDFAALSVRKVKKLRSAILKTSALIKKLEKKVK